MARPWKRIAIDFAAGIASLVAAHQLRRLSTEDADANATRAATDDAAAVGGADDWGPVRLQPAWVIFGAITSIAWSYTDDADVWKLRSSRKRRFTLHAWWGVLAYRYLPDDVSTTYSVSIGTGIGTLCYRFWYGIVRPRRAG